MDGYALPGDALLGRWTVRLLLPGDSTRPLFSFTRVMPSDGTRDQVGCRRRHRIIVTLDDLYRTTPHQADPNADSIGGARSLLFAVT